MNIKVILSPTLLLLAISSSGYAIDSSQICNGFVASSKSYLKTAANGSFAGSSVDQIELRNNGYHAFLVTLEKRCAQATEKNIETILNDAENSCEKACSRTALHTELNKQSTCFSTCETPRVLYSGYRSGMSDGYSKCTGSGPAQGAESSAGALGGP
jgi:hypothetical protein